MHERSLSSPARNWRQSLAQETDLEQQNVNERSGLIRDNDNAKSDHIYYPIYNSLSDTGEDHDNSNRRTIETNRNITVKPRIYEIIKIGRTMDRSKFLAWHESFIGQLIYIRFLISITTMFNNLQPALVLGLILNTILSGKRVEFKLYLPSQPIIVITLLFTIIYYIEVLYLPFEDALYNGGIVDVPLGVFHYEIGEEEEEEIEEYFVSYPFASTRILASIFPNVTFGLIPNNRTLLRNNFEIANCIIASKNPVLPLVIGTLNVPDAICVKGSITELFYRKISYFDKVNFNDSVVKRESLVITNATYSLNLAEIIRLADKLGCTTVYTVLLGDSSLLQNLNGILLDSNLKFTRSRFGEDITFENLETGLITTVNSTTVWTHWTTTCIGIKDYYFKRIKVFECSAFTIIKYSKVIELYTANIVLRNFSDYVYLSVPVTTFSVFGRRDIYMLPIRDFLLYYRARRLVVNEPLLAHRTWPDGHRRDLLNQDLRDSIDLIIQVEDEVLEEVTLYRKLLVFLGLRRTKRVSEILLQEYVHENKSKIVCQGNFLRLN